MAGKRQLSPFHQMHQPDQDNRTDSGADQAANKSCCRKADEAEDKPTKKRTEHTYKQVTEEAKTSSFHDESGEPSRD